MSHMPNRISFLLLTLWLAQCSCLSFIPSIFKTKFKPMWEKFISAYGFGDSNYGIGEELNLYGYPDGRAFKLKTKPRTVHAPRSSRHRVLTESPVKLAEKIEVAPNTPPPPTGCKIAVPDLKFSPIFTDISNGEAIYPNKKNKSFYLEYGKLIKINCQNNIIVGVNETTKLVARCTNNHLYVNKSPLVNNELQCNGIPEPKATLTTNQCGEVGKLIKIGYELEEDHFKNIIKVCYYVKLNTPLYSSHKLLYKRSDGLKFTDLDFQEGNFFNNTSDNISLKELYEEESQRETVNFLLYLDFDSNKIIDPTKNYVLEPGALAPPEDFSQYPDVESVYFYVNSVPIWKIIKETTWKNIEEQIRRFSKKKQVDLEIYTGIYGSVVFENSKSDKMISIYILVDDLKKKKSIPVPKILWKVVYERKSRKAVVIICENNPHLKLADLKMRCKDVSSKIGWMKFNTEFENGYTYACDVDDLRKKISYIPKLEVNGLLE